MSTICNFQSCLFLFIQMHAYCFRKYFRRQIVHFLKGSRFLSSRANLHPQIYLIYGKALFDFLNVIVCRKCNGFKHIFIYLKSHAIGFVGLHKCNLDCISGNGLHINYLNNRISFFAIISNDFN